MRATSLLLPEELHRRVRETAARRGESLGAFVRRALHEALREGASPGEARAGPTSPGQAWPATLDEYLAAPAGAFAGLGLPGDESEPEDPAADVD